MRRTGRLRERRRQLRVAPPAAPVSVTGAIFVPSSGRHWLAALVAGALLPIGFAVAARTTPEPPRVRHAAPMKREMTVELAPTIPPPLPPVAAAPVPPAPSSVSTARPVVRRVRPSAAPAPAPAPAQAAAVVAAEAPGEALDLTAFTIPTGGGARFAGGKTSGEGTSTRAVESGADPRGVANGTGVTADGDLSTPVRLPASEWDCPWPREAEAASIDEASAVIRVTVDASGRPEIVALVSSPGHGFGDAALACARRARFEPARDRAGNAVRARSGPIRVQFTR